MDIINGHESAVTGNAPTYLLPLGLLFLFRGVLENRMPLLVLALRGVASSSVLLSSTGSRGSAWGGTPSWIAAGACCVVVVVAHLVLLPLHSSCMMGVDGTVLFSLECSPSLPRTGPISLRYMVGPRHSRFRLAFPCVRRFLSITFLSSVIPVNLVMWTSGYLKYKKMYV